MSVITDDDLDGMQETRCPECFHKPISHIEEHGVCVAWVRDDGLMCGCQYRFSDSYATPEHADEYFRTRDSMEDPPDVYLKHAEEVLDGYFEKPQK